MARQRVMVGATFHCTEQQLGLHFTVKVGGLYFMIRNNGSQNGRSNSYRWGLYFRLVFGGLHFTVQNSGSRNGWVKGHSWGIRFLIQDSQECSLKVTVGV